MGPQARFTREAQELASLNRTRRAAIILWRPRGGEGLTLEIDMSAVRETLSTPQPLTVLEEDDRLFQTTVRQFAREQIGPHVRAMDEKGEVRKDLLKQFFELGLMGIEIPEEYGGQGGTFFQAVLAVEELAAVDPSAAVIVDVQNTLVNNAVLRWASA